MIEFELSKEQQATQHMTHMLAETMLRKAAREADTNSEYPTRVLEMMMRGGGHFWDGNADGSKPNKRQCRGYPG